MLTVKLGGFPGSPVVRTRRFHCHGPGSIPGQGTKITQAAQHSQRKKEEKKQTKTVKLVLIFGNVYNV